MRVRRHLGLRTRTTALATGFSALVLWVGALLLLFTLERQLTTSADDLSRSRLRDLSGQVEAGELPALLRNVNDEGVAQVVAADGTVLAASPNIAGRGPIVTDGPEPGDEVRVIDAPDDTEIETYRVWVSAVATPDGSVIVVVGTSLESVREASSTLRGALVVGVPAGVLVLGLLIWLVLGRALARLDRIRAEVDTIGPEQLDRQIEDDGVPDEVGRLAATMNRMLGRLDDAARRQRRFVADVSHDLQSPLTAQRVSLELALADPRGVDPSVLRDDVLGATEEMESLVADLLLLAAIDDGVAPEPRAVDLDGVVLEEAIRIRPGARVTVDTSRVSAGPVSAHAEDLRRLVRNLLENATAHAASRVEVVLEVVEDAALVRLDVIDDGPGVPGDQRALVFERFHRGDPTRSRGTPGTGLGLSIARSLAERCGGTLELVGGGPGARFRLELPSLSPGPGR